MHTFLRFNRFSICGLKLNQTSEVSTTLSSLSSTFSWKQTSCLWRHYPSLFLVMLTQDRLRKRTLSLPEIWLSSRRAFFHLPIELPASVMSFSMTTIRQTLQRASELFITVTAHGSSTNLAVSLIEWLCHRQCSQLARIIGHQCSLQNESEDDKSMISGLTNVITPRGSEADLIVSRPRQKKLYNPAESETMKVMVRFFIY